jgi:biopolymer transport protein ExbD
MTARVPWVACIGIVLILAGIALPWWLGEDAALVPLAFVIAGSILTIRSTIARRESLHWKTIKLAEPGPQPGGLHFETSAFEAAGKAGQFFQWAIKAPLRKPFTGPPAFGLTATLVLFVVLAPMWVLQSLTPARVGFNVHLLLPGYQPVSEPVVLQLKMNPGKFAGRPRLFLRSGPVAWIELREALEEELKSRPDRVVYLEGDPEMVFDDAVKAMDVIRNLRAEVVMLTPGTKQERRLEDNSHDQR